LILLEKGWEKVLGKKTRFALFAFFSYFTYGMFVNVKGVDGDLISKIYVSAFTSIDGAAGGILLSTLLLLGLWISLIAASLGQSLLAGGRGD